MQAIVLEIVVILTVLKITHQDDAINSLHKNLELESLTILTPPPCDPKIEFLYIIHTAPSHFNLRNTLRNTWASTTAKPDQINKTRRVFVIGKSSDTIEDSNRKEYDLHGDIFMYDMVESYRNMTIKVTFHLINCFISNIPAFCLSLIYFLENDIFLFLFSMSFYTNGLLNTVQMLNIS